MKNPFLNSAEHRLRAFWRLLLVSGLNWIVVLILQTSMGIILGIMAVVNGVDISNSQNIQDTFTNNPYLPALTAFVTLLATGLVFLLASRLDRRPLKGFGFQFNSLWWRDFGFGLLLGAFLMALIFAVELAAGWIKITATLQTKIPGQSFWIGFLLSFLVFFCVGIYEEMTSRGYLLRNLAEGLRSKYISPKLAILAAYVLSSIIFGYLHAGNPNASIISTVFLMAAGLFLGLGFILTGELAIPIGLHMSWNFFQGSVFGFPVSGLKLGDSLITIQQGGPDFITGGTFGPEAGLIGLAAIILGGLMIVLWLRMTRERAVIAQNLAVYTPALPLKQTAEAPAAES